jgi:hypothetical protein
LAQKSGWQSQTNPILERSKMNVNIYYKKAYINETAFGRKKFKPKTKPISPPISVPAALIIDYYLHPAYNDAQNFERANYGFRAK